MGNLYFLLSESMSISFHNGTILTCLVTRTHRMELLQMRSTGTSFASYHLPDLHFQDTGRLLVTNTATVNSIAQIATPWSSMALRRFRFQLRFQFRSHSQLPALRSRPSGAHRWRLLARRLRTTLQVHIWRSNPGPYSILGDPRLRCKTGPGAYWTLRPPNLSVRCRCSI